MKGCGQLQKKKAIGVGGASQEVDQMLEVENS